MAAKKKRKKRGTTAGTYSTGPRATGRMKGAKRATECMDAAALLAALQRATRRGKTSKPAPSRAQQGRKKK